MGSILNVTPFAVGELAGKDPAGRPLFVAVVKATYAWAGDGTTALVETQPVVECDEHAGDPPTTGLLRASELTPPRPRVDVLLQGALVFPAAIDAVDVSLQIGSRVNKTVRVTGDRVWLPGMVRDVVPSRPRRVTRVALAWELAFGGIDARDSRCAEMRNPAGSGMTKSSRELEGKPAPSFEDPRQPIRSSNDRPVPQGFGPVAPFWEPRRRFAGTYDAKWKETRSPLLPLDFDPRFWNCAPSDQQLDDYQPGEVVRLTYMTMTGHDTFRLPAFAPPVLFATRESIHETVAEVDTVIIEPEARRFSLVARAAHSPRPNLLAMRSVIVGEPTPGMRRALETGKVYADWRAAAAAADAKAGGKR